MKNIFFFFFGGGKHDFKNLILISITKWIKWIYEICHSLQKKKKNAGHATGTHNSNVLRKVNILTYDRRIVFPTSVIT